MAVLIDRIPECNLSFKQLRGNNASYINIAHNKETDTGHKYQEWIGSLKFFEDDEGKEIRTKLVGIFKQIGITELESELI